MELPPFHDRFCAPVAVEPPELALALHRCRNAVGEVLPAIGDYVPGDAVLGREGARTGAQPGEGGEVRAQPQVQRDAAGVDTQV